MSDGEQNDNNLPGLKKKESSSTSEFFMNNMEQKQPKSKIN